MNYRDTILRFFALPLVLVLTLASCSQQTDEQTSDNKTVLLAILARNKAHLLPTYLQTIQNLDYNKKRITLYINTNNNRDRTKEILEEWVKKHQDQYRAVFFESHEVQEAPFTKPHDWTPERLKLLATIRNKSLKKAKETKSDFYFVVDCDNFLTPCTLRHLVNKNKPIIAPMLKAVPHEGDLYSNYFCATDDYGYWADHADYVKITKREMVGTFKVPVVHCTYLIKSDYIDKLNYIDETDHHEFVIFSRTARENDVDQFICNEEDFGTLLHCFGDLSLEQEAERMKDVLPTLVKESEVSYTQTSSRFGI